MVSSEIKKYLSLNKLSESSGIVIFGGTEDTMIPLGELRQAFSIDSKMYNRSVSNLSVKNAIELYNECVSSLTPETILLHIGDADLSNFKENSSEFDNNYRKLIAHIRTESPACRIAIVSLRNPENDETILEMNKHLKYIANSEQCEYVDITLKKVWNPKNTMDAVSFGYSMGFLRPFINKRPLYELGKILFYYQQ